MAIENESSKRSKRLPSALQSDGFRREEVVTLDTYLVRDKMPDPTGNAGSGNAG